MRRESGKAIVVGVEKIGSDDGGGEIHLWNWCDVVETRCTAERTRREIESTLS